jgi:hypothetical protein
MTEDEKCARYTGFRSTGKNGYLRQSWGSLRVWNSVFNAIFGISWSEMLFSGWNGYNDGEGPDLSKPEERQQLENNIKKLEEYIANPTPVPKSCEQYFGVNEWEKAAQIVAEEVQEVIDFIKLALNKKGAVIQFS